MACPPEPVEVFYFYKSSIKNKYMLNRWVLTINDVNEFYIIDKIVKDGNTCYIGHYEYTNEFSIIIPEQIVSFGKKTRFQQ